MTEITKPNETEYNPYYQGYIEKMDGFSVAERLSIQSFLLEEVLSELDAEQVDEEMAPGKWTYNQAIGHLLDTEKIMHFRILAIARDPGVELSGFDQDKYVAKGNFIGVDVFKANLNAIALNRNLLRLMLQHLTEDQLLRQGTVGGHPISVRALYYIICGHMQHHLILLRQYLRREV